MLIVFNCCIGSGATATVFSFKPYDETEEEFKLIDNSHYAIKVFADEKHFNQEIANNAKIKERFEGNIPSFFVKQHRSIPEKRSIIYKPIGKRIKDLTKNQIIEIFDAVKLLHTKGIIHRDLSPNHFYQVFI